MQPTMLVMDSNFTNHVFLTKLPTWQLAASMSGVEVR